MRISRLGAALAVAALLPLPAAAQESGAIALDQLEPSPAGDPFFSVPSPFIGGHVVPRGELLFSHAAAPLTLTEGDVEREVVGGQSLLHFGASLALWDRLLVHANLPLAVAQSGEGALPAPGQAAPGAPASPVLGDLRLGARIRLLGEERDPIQIGGGFTLHLPTGASDAYTGEGSVRIAPQLLLGGRAGDMLVWSATAGTMVRSSGNPTTLTWGAGAGFLLLDERLQIGPELHAATPLQGGSLGLSERTRVEHARSTRAELLLGVRARVIAGLVLGAAAGPGLGEGIGTPAFRAIGTLSWAPPPPRPRDEASGPVDTDEDGLLDAQDACPYAHDAHDAHNTQSADPRRNGCPVEDRDEDKVADQDDACPDTAGATSADPRRNGCPPDADADGLIDTLDACPTEPGPAVAPEGAKPGCPATAAAADSDGDAISDDKDACPREKGPTSDDAKSTGCPKRVRVQGDEVVLLEPVAFKILPAPLPPIEPKSEPVLEEIKEVLQQHPEWTKIEVQSHTDNVGNAKYNETFSGLRAESVKKWLVDHGVAAERLVARGYGSNKPIADNATKAGKEKNRRVQLVVLEKK